MTFRTYAFILFLCIWFPFFTNAQCDYSTEKYGFAVQKRILYGVLPDYQNIPDSLFLDVYYPVGSPEAEKPTVIWAFGGGFFQGKREDFAKVCEKLAKQGIVSATIDYRLGFEGLGFGLNPPFAYDAAEILRAGYRGATDMKGAIRYLKARHKDFDIDLSRFWIGGASAGAIVALNSAFLNKDSEKPAAANAIAPAGTRMRPDLGPIEGSLNLNGYDASVQGIFNIFGALLDTAAIDPNDKMAIISYHQTGDPIVPCAINTPYYPIPLIAQNYPVVFGTCAITERIKHIGLDELYWESWFYPGTEHALHNEDSVLHYMITQAKPFFCKTVTQSQESNEWAIGLSPNPVSSHFQINHLEKECSYKILNYTGHTLCEGRIQAGQSVQVENLLPGFYLLEMNDGTKTKTIPWNKL